MTRVRFVKTDIIGYPREGEWFVGYDGNPVKANFDFHGQEFPILRLDLVDYEEEEGCLNYRLET